MRTPREILLARHQTTEPKLDAIREVVVGELNSQDAKTQSWTVVFVSSCLRFPNTLWRELILPSRRIWAGLAAVWLSLLILNVSQRDTVSSVTGKPVQSPAVMMSWQDQQRWMNELLADRVTPSEADRLRTVTPRPHTEDREIRNV